MKTDGKNSSQHVIPLRNAGNIPLEVCLEVTHWRELFTFTPAYFTSQPGGETQVTIQFKSPANAEPKTFQRYVWKNNNYTLFSLSDS